MLEHVTSLLSKISVLPTKRIRSAVLLFFFFFCVLFLEYSQSVMFLIILSHVSSTVFAILKLSSLIVYLHIYASFNH